ncbi:MAG: T9SS type A sorting domain-containing protein [Cyclobacteriaceae bacterium]|nr:T9SS type A sorting domain-containing protein [Cyclobacteriaceae bacterium HetDA_MAG_MS6]
MKYFFVTVILLCSCPSLFAADKTWTGAVDSDWEDPNNWNGGTLPANGDNLFIDADDYTTAPIITTASSFDPSDVTIRDGGILSMTGGSLNPTDDLFINTSGQFTVTGGSIDLNDDLNIDAGTFSFAGSTFNADDVFVTNGGDIAITSGTTDVNDDINIDGSGSTFSFSGTSLLADDIFSNSNADIQITSGTVDIADDVIVDGGDFSFSGTSLDADDFNIDNDGDVSLTSGAVTVADDIDVNGTGSSFDFSGASLALDELKALDNATVDLTSGTVTLSNHIDGDSGATITIATTVTQSGTKDIQIGADVTVNVQSGANVSGFRHIDFQDTDNGSFSMTGGSVDIDGDVRLDDSDGNSFSISAGTLDVGDDFEIEGDNITVTINGTADVNVGDDFKLGQNGGSDNDATNTTVTIGGSASLDVTDNIQFFEGGSGSNTTITVEDSAFVVTDSIDDNTSVTITDSAGVDEGGTQLPVELLAFDLMLDGSNVVISWSTATEVNNEGFQLLRSVDGESFNVIGEVDGQGNSESQHQYEFVDNNSPRGLVYYQLKQIDFDGNFELFPVEVIENSNYIAKLERSNAVLLGNPVIGNRLQVGFTSWKEEQVHATIVDMQGRHVFSQVLNVSGNKIEIAGLPNLLNKGVYLLHLQAGELNERLRFIYAN